MSAERKKPHGMLYKATELLLGVASAASIVLDFIPGVNIFGISAIIQGAVTLVQTGMDLVTDGVKKASKTFAIGAVFTGLSLIPFLGGAAIIAKTGKAAEEVEGLAKSGNIFVRAWRGIKNFFGRMWGHVTETSPAKAINQHMIQPAATRLNTTEKNLTEKTAEWLKKHPKLLSAADKINTHHKTAMAVQIGGTAAATGLSMMNDSPPATLADPSNYDYSDNDRREWRKYVREREQQRALADSLPSH